MARPTISPQERRTATLSSAVTPKLKYLVEIAAKLEGDSVSDFIGEAVEKAIIESLPPRWGEGLWDEDKITRVCLLGVADHNLLDGQDKRIWNDFVNGLAKSGKKLKVEEFREYYQARVVEEIQ